MGPLSLPFPNPEPLPKRSPIMLIDNRHGGPLHIPHTDGILTLPPGISEITEAVWNAATKPAEGVKLPPVLREILRASIQVIEDEVVEESPISLIPRIFDRALLSPFMSHEDAAVRKAALDQDALIQSRLGA